MGGLYVNEISFAQWLGNGLHWRVIGLCIDMVSPAYFVASEWDNFFFFILSNLSVLTAVVEVIFGRWRLLEEPFYLSLNGAQCGILFYNQSLDKRVFCAHNICPSI